MKAIGLNLRPSPVVINQRFEKASRVSGSSPSPGGPSPELPANQATSRFNKARRERIGEDLNPGTLEATDSRRIAELSVGTDGHVQDPVTGNVPLQQCLAVRVEGELRNPQIRLEGCNDLLGPRGGHGIGGGRTVAIPIRNRAFLHGFGQGQSALANPLTVLGYQETLRYRGDASWNGLRFIRRAAIRSPPRGTTRGRDSPVPWLSFPHLQGFGGDAAEEYVVFPVSQLRECFLDTCHVAICHGKLPAHVAVDIQYHRNGSGIPEGLRSQ